MADQPITVRPARTEAEIEHYFLLAARTFGDGDPEVTAREWRRFFGSTPTFDPSGWRVAARDHAVVGGYAIFPRVLRIGPARLLTGCISGVVVHSNHRSEGIGWAMMRDAIAYAGERRYALLMLDGIPGFYRQFGYVDVADRTEHTVRSSDIPTLPQSGVQVRAAGPPDAVALRALYDRHYGPFPGSFDHSVEALAHRLSFPSRGHTLLALDQRGTPRGYLILSRSRPNEAREAAADSWPALRALLQEQLRLARARLDRVEHLLVGAPPGSTTMSHLSDHLAIRSVTHVQPYADWMARPVDLAVLVEAVQPLWTHRVARSSAPWVGQLTLLVEDAAFAISLEGGSVRVRSGTAPGPEVRLTRPSFVQLLFGYRTAHAIAARDGVHVPDEMLPLLDVLFPPLLAWIPGSDEF